jgi:hypothetical protein
MLCNNCTYETEHRTNGNSIWDFEPRNYTSYNELINTLKQIPKGTFLEKNEDGYTYFHWYVYFIGKVGKDYQKYYPKIIWFFNALSELYPNEISSYLNEGMIDNTNYTCLHHLYKWCDNSNKINVKKMALI